MKYNTIENAMQTCLTYYYWWVNPLIWVTCSLKLQKSKYLQLPMLDLYLIKSLQALHHTEIQIQADNLSLSYWGYR